MPFLGFLEGLGAGSCLAWWFLHLNKDPDPVHDFAGSKRGEKPPEEHLHSPRASPLGMCWMKWYLSILKLGPTL